MQQNPTEPVRPERGQPCGLLRLLLVMLYDGVILLGLLLVAAAIASPFDSGHQQALRDPGFTLYLLAVWFAYLSVCWRNGGMTIGMRAWRVRLEANHRRPGWGQCVLRFLLSLISAACAGLGFFWMLVDRDKRSWHDMASDTRLTVTGQSNRTP